uniref:Protoheme IX farnesyltransferase n=1 Tax=Candidatus Methanogaster sp. ANME-2c ERB4 TaxID=2759911 RepID=A0A7G9YJA2_9EURY|nr:protoheme IX farnesyltransferase [Methanosarcinales archaeon ANME-2c ERB4]
MVSTIESKPKNPYIEMLRPEIADMDLALPAASALLASYLLVGAFPPLIPFIIAVIGGYAAITSSYVFNDCCDIDIDEINLPNRPLPSSNISKKQALFYSLFLAIIASVTALYLNPESFVILLIAVTTISIYSIVAKRMTFLSFLPVGIAYGLVPIGIWLAFDPAGILKESVDSLILPIPAIFLGMMICVTDWGFTLSGVARDVEGDRAKGAPTFPVTFGVPATSKFVTLCWVAGFVASIVIGWTAHLGPIFFAGAIFAGTWMLTQSFDFIKNPLPERGGRLFLQGSRYRSVLFVSLIVDVVLSTIFTSYVSILW